MNSTFGQPQIVLEPHMRMGIGHGFILEYVVAYQDGCLKST